MKCNNDLIPYNETLFLQDEAAPADKQYKQEPAQVTYSTSAVSSTQEVLYINGNGTYSYHSYRGLGSGLLNLSDASSSGEFPYQCVRGCISLPQY